MPASSAASRRRRPDTGPPHGKDGLTRLIRRGRRYTAPCDKTYQAEGDREPEQGSSCVFCKTSQNGSGSHLHFPQVLRRHRERLMLDQRLVAWIKDGLSRPGKSQNGLAEALDVDPSSVSRLLKGARQVKTR